MRAGGFPVTPPGSRLDGLRGEWGYWRGPSRRIRAAAMTASLPRDKLSRTTDARSGPAGYVLDNMEGAVDQARFLAATDMPLAIIGARGTGKLYLAKLYHQASGASPDALRLLDCRECRGRDESWRRLLEAMLAAPGQTLVLKSPQLLHPEVQKRLARLVATRRLPTQDGGDYLPPLRFAALFPASLTALVEAGELQARLASVFAGHPIHVPPLRARPQAILRWAGKILQQESARHGSRLQGYTPEAEQAMRRHQWHGNLSELRQRVVRAMERRPEADWLSAADLQLYEGGRSAAPATLWTLQTAADVLAPSAWEELQIALAELLQAIVAGDCDDLPLGQWLRDELLLASLARYAGVASQAARLVQTSPRNVQRWYPAARQRDVEREACVEWSETRRLIQDWVRGLGLEGESPLLRLESLLLSRLEACSDRLPMARRVGLLGVSRPTYQKRLREYEMRESLR